MNDDRRLEAAVASGVLASEEQHRAGKIRDDP
jgi:hypothetical protein